MVTTSYRPRRRARWVRIAALLAGTFLLVGAVSAGGYALWYHRDYGIWPGQAVWRVQWCGRHYDEDSRSRYTWAQISAQAPGPIRVVASYPPLGPRGQLLAAVTPSWKRFSSTPPLPCTMVVYVRVGPDSYLAYPLSGGP